MQAETDRVWKALGDPVRRRILDLLAERPLTTGAIVAEFTERCRTAVMKHLDVLVDVGLVVIRREGRTRWNYLNPVPIERICRRWIDRHVRRMASALGRIKDLVESDAGSAMGRKETRKRGRSKDRGSGGRPI